MTKSEAVVYNQDTGEVISRHEAMGMTAIQFDIPEGCTRIRVEWTCGR